MGRAIRILLVDDDNNLTDGLRRSLRQEQYEILSANSAMDATQFLSDPALRLIVTDNQMPGVQGIDFLTRLKTEFPHVPRILITGNASVDLAMRAINEAEVFRFFVKPINVIDLALSVRDAIDRNRPEPTVKSLVDEAKFQERLDRAINGCVSNR